MKESLLIDTLYRAYTSAPRPGKDRIRLLFKKIDRLVNELSLQENGGIMDLVCELCSEYEPKAFVQGMGMGARMVLELAGEWDEKTSMAPVDTVESSTKA